MKRSYNGTDFEKALRSLGPAVAMAALGGIAAASARNNGKFKFKWDDIDDRFTKGMGGKGGVPLTELDMGGDVPEEVVLAGADHVVITHGDEFTISVQGDEDAKETLRFRLQNGALHIASRNSSNGGEGIATVNVTMPAPSKVTIAGAGQLAVSSLADQAALVIAGSGRITVLDLDIDKLNVTVAGSGRLTAGGEVDNLKLKIAGSGRAKLSKLHVNRANIDVLGSGRATFSSDGKVRAKIMGSGQITVRGTAECNVTGLGAGTLKTKPRK